jgi:hypothetical protein
VVNAVDDRRHEKFLDHLKYIVTTSQLLDAQPQFGAVSGAALSIQIPDLDSLLDPYATRWTVDGAIAVVTLSFGIAALARWFSIGGAFTITPTRALFAVLGSVAILFLFAIYMRRRWLKYIHEGILHETTKFVEQSAQIDGVLSSALSFLVEVELLSRGYRL